MASTSYSHKPFPILGAHAIPSLQTGHLLAIVPSGVGVPPKLAQRIWAGEFIEMYELLPEKLGQVNVAGPSREDGRRTRGKRVTNILQWVECFHSYMGIVVQAQPERTQDFLAYASLIVHAARKYKGEGWATYDRNFCRQAAVHPQEKWGDSTCPFGL